jgi:hypothetical protein
MNDCFKDHEVNMAIRAKEIKGFLKAAQLAFFYCSLPRFHIILFPLAIALAYYDNKTVAPPNGAKNW